MVFKGAPLARTFPGRRLLGRHLPACGDGRKEENSYSCSGGIANIAMPHEKAQDYRRFFQ